MNKQQHTPGPWHVKKPHHIMCGRISVAYVDAFRSERDLYLMAAAPELLEALELLANPSTSSSRGSGESYIGWQAGEGLTARERLDKARAAIAKARGE